MLLPILMPLETFVAQGFYDPDGSQAQFGELSGYHIASLLLLQRKSPAHTVPSLTQGPTVQTHLETFPTLGSEAAAQLPSAV